MIDKIRTYVEETFNWCDECVKREGTVKMITTRPLFLIELKQPATRCSGCGKEVDGK